MSLTVERPDEVASALGVPAAELEREATKELAFFARGGLSIGKAAETSGLPRQAFEAMLAQRGIERPVTATEVERDVNWGRT